MDAVSRSLMLFGLHKVVTRLTSQLGKNILKTRTQQLLMVFQTDTHESALLFFKIAKTLMN